MPPTSQDDQQPRGGASQSPSPEPPESPAMGGSDHVGARRVLALSTTAFTLMFAAWLMFGILGKPISEEFGLSEVQLSWIIAVAVLNGSLWRLPAGMITDRIGGRKVMTFLLAQLGGPAVPRLAGGLLSPCCWSWPSSSASPATRSAPASPGTPPGSRGSTRASRSASVRRGQRRRLGHQVHRASADRRDDGGRDLSGHLPGRLALRPGRVRRPAARHGRRDVDPGAAPRTGHPASPCR